MSDKVAQARAVSEIRMHLDKVLEEEIPKIIEQIIHIQKYLEILQKTLSEELVINGRT